MERINFEDGQLVKEGYVEIDGVKHTVTEAEYSGDTPLSAYMMNKLQDNIENEINSMDGGDTLPVGTIVEYDGDTVPEGYEKVDDEGLIKSTTISGTTSTYGNITTGLDKTKYVPFAANANNDNAFVNFYCYESSPYWTAHFNEVGSGDTLTNTEFTNVIIYYMEIN